MTDLPPPQPVGESVYEAVEAEARARRLYKAKTWIAVGVLLVVLLLQPFVWLWAWRLLTR